MKIIFQTNLHGHRGEYIDHLISSEKCNSEKFVVWVKDCTSDEIAKFAKSPSVENCLIGPFSSKILKQNLVKGKPNSIIFLDGDNEFRSIITLLARVPAIQTTALMMRLNFSSTPTLRFALKWAGKFVLTFLLNLLPRVSMRRLVFLQKPKVSVFKSVRDPLPYTSSGKPLNNLEGSGGQFNIGIAGTIDPRKNIELAIKVLSQLGSGYILSLAGQVTPSFKPKLTELVGESNNVLVRDALLSDTELDAEILSAGCFLVLQNVNAPSGTLLRALSLGVPTVLGGAKILKKAAAMFPDNVVWTELDPYSLHLAILKAREMSRNPVLELPSPEDFSADLIG